MTVNNGENLASVRAKINSAIETASTVAGDISTLQGDVAAIRADVSAMGEVIAKTAAQWTSDNTVLEANEIGLETDTGRAKYGDGSTAWNSLPYSDAVFGERNAVNAAAAASLPDGVIVTMGGLQYEVDSTATGTASATNDLGVDGLAPFGSLVLDQHYGVLGNGATDDSAKLQAMMDFAGANGKSFLITQRCACASPLYIKYHGQSGGYAATGQIVYTGTGAAVRSQRVGSIYPVNPSLAFSIELTADSQAGWDYQLSYTRSHCRLEMDMNDPNCTNCVGLNLMGDKSNGSGSYYNTIVVRGQGNHLTNSHLVRTVNDEGDYTSNRGPNANTVIIERSGQFDVAIYDRIGAGNRFIVRSCEAASAATAYCFYAGNDTSASYLTQNTYEVYYLENVDYIFQSISGRYGGSCRLVATMATGGEAVSDPIDMLREMRGVPGFYHRIQQNQPFVVEASGARYPRFEGTIPYIDIKDLVLNKTLQIGSAGQWSQALGAMQMTYDGTTLFRIGTTRVSPVQDNVKDLGAATERFKNVFAAALYPGAGAVSWTSGTGSPEGVRTAPVGSMFTRTDGGGGTTLYVKETGTGNTGWVAK